MSDELRQLIRSCLAGDQQAMAELVRRFQGPVYGLCYRILGQRQDAEDTAQETFLRALRSLHLFDIDREFEPWLLTIAGNRCRTRLSQLKNRPLAAPLTEPLPDHRANAEAPNHLAEEVQLALGELRYEYRQAFLMFHNHEMSYAEIGQALNCPLGTVKTWVHRARRELIAQLRSRGVLAEKRGSIDAV